MKLAPLTVGSGQFWCQAQEQLAFLSRSLSPRSSLCPSQLAHHPHCRDKPGWELAGFNLLRLRTQALAQHLQYRSRPASSHVLTKALPRRQPPPVPCSTTSASGSQLRASPRGALQKGDREDIRTTSLCGCGRAEPCRNSSF